MSETGSEQPQKANEISRREFLRKFTATGAGALFASSFLSACAELDEKPADEKPEKVEYQEANSNLKKIHETENMPNLGKIVETADLFMDYPPQSEERERIELDLVTELAEDSTPSDVLLSLQALSTVQARNRALNLLFEKRQAGEMAEFGFQPLSDEKIDWAEENDIDPLTLSIAEDCFIPSLVIFEAAPHRFLEAVPEEKRQKIIEKNKLPHRIPNPGFIAKLLMTETSGWRNIGTVPAVTQINTDPDLFPTAVNDLKSIANKFSRYIPYKKHLDTLPGSIKTEDSLSGGAIGPQIMPNNALQFVKWYDEANNKLRKKYPSPNPFDIYTGTILAYLFVASEFKARHAKVDEYGTHPQVYDEIVRPGYNREEKEKIEESAAKWNPDADQIRKISEAGKGYEKNF